MSATVGDLSPAMSKYPVVNWGGAQTLVINMNGEASTDRRVSGARLVDLPGLLTLRS
jgi:hypothetical protein